MTIEQYDEAVDSLKEPSLNFEEHCHENLDRFSTTYTIYRFHLLDFHIKLRSSTIFLSIDSQKQRDIYFKRHRAFAISVC